MTVSYFLFQSLLEELDRHESHVLTLISGALKRIAENEQNPDAQHCEGLVADLAREWQILKQVAFERNGLLASISEAQQVRAGQTSY